MTERDSEFRAEATTGAREAEGAPNRVRLRDRDAEIRSAEAAVDKLCRDFAAGGTEIGELLTFSGRPGIGKTTLLHEVRRIAKLRPNATVLFARGGERQFNEPYHVLRQLLQPVLGSLGPGEFRQVMGTWRRSSDRPWASSSPRRAPAASTRRASGTAWTSSSPSSPRAAPRW